MEEKYKEIFSQFKDEEGDSIGKFLLKCFSLFTLKNKTVLEIGPRHGLHTSLIDMQDPKYITMIELPEKRLLTDSWISSIKTPNIVNWSSFDTFHFYSGTEFDFILHAGVLHHNENQMLHLRKAFDVLRPGGHMIIESATCRDSELVNNNCIEVFSDAQRQRIMFRPTKTALMMMLTQSRFTIMKTTDDLDCADCMNEFRLGVLVRKEKDHGTRCD